MIITIDWLVHQLELPGFRYLAGQIGGGNCISGANMIDNPNTVPWLKQGDLVLSTGYFLQNHPQCCADLIPQLSRNGCAGLGIKLNRYIDSLPEEMRRQAEQLSFPVFAIPFSSNMEQIFRLIYQRIFREERDEQLLIAARYRELVDAALKNQSLPRLLELLQEDLENPVYLTDGQLNCLECCLPGGTTGRETPYNTCLLEPSSVNMIQTAQLEQNYPLIRRSVPWRGAERVVTLVPLKNRQTPLGYLLVPEENHPLARRELELLSNAQSLLCVAVLRYLQTGRSAASQDDQLLPLFTDHTMSDSRRRFQCVQHGLLFQGNHLLAQVRIKPGKRLSRTQAAQLHKRLFERLELNGSACRVTKISTDQNLLLYFAFPGEERSSVCENCAREICQQFQTLAKEEESLACTIGLSACCDGVHTLPVCYQQTEQALELGPRLRPEEQLHLYSDYQALYTLASSLSREQLMDFYHRVLGDLERYDLEHNAKLVELLEVYLQTEQNTKLTSELLYIHRNTALYKLRQISELLGYDIKRPERIYTLQTVFYLKKILSL